MNTVTTAVNYGIKLTEFAGGIRFGTDSLLVSEFCPRCSNAVDLGSGSGVIGLLLLAAGKAKNVTGVEISSEYARLAVRNAGQNGFSREYSCVCADVADVKRFFGAGTFGLCVSNPPYLPAGTGVTNESGLKHAAFHETASDIGGFCAAAAYLLKYGGRFCCVYRPEYVQRLLAAAGGNGLALKRLRFVHPDRVSPPSLLLAEFRKGGGAGASVLPPLFIYDDTEHKKFGAEIQKIIAC
ncbi:MAG: methyltransferase [Clostridia bacterium]|nr:methyltransferase [Clostridia bacterium]